MLRGGAAPGCAAGPALYAKASTMAFSVALGRIAAAVFSGLGR